MRIHRSVAPAFLAASALVIAACGGSQATPTQAVVGDPTAGPGGGGGRSLDGEDGLCRRFTMDQATAALGEQVGAGQANKGTIGGLTYFCRYTGKVSGAVIDLEYSPGKTQAEWEEELRGVGMLAETKVDGIGDAAWEADGSALGDGWRISFYAEGAFWVVIARDGEATRMRDAAREAAKDLLAGVNG